MKSAAHPIYLDIVKKSLYSSEPAAQWASPNLEFQLWNGDGTGLRLQHVTI